MRHGLTDGCLGCRCLAERKRAQGHSEGCRKRLEVEIAKTEDGRARLTTAYLRSLPRDEGREPDVGAEAPAAVPEPSRPDGVQDEPIDAREASEDGKARLTTAYLRSLPRDEGREPDAGAEAPAAVPEPPRPDGVQDEPMDAREASRKRSAEDAGHEADDAGRGGAQPDPGSMVDDSMPKLRREAEARGADAVALAEAYSSTSRQRAGSFSLSAGVAMDLRLRWDLRFAS